MASHSSPDLPQPPKHKMWVLKVSIHCEGCKRKVKKILQQLPGVHEIDIDIRQQRVVVTGDVQADTLIRKLVKSGKNAELWPQVVAQGEGLPAVAVKEVKELNRKGKQEDCSTSGNGAAGVQKEAKPPGKVAVVIQEPPAKKSEDGIEGSGGASGADNNGENGSAGGDGGGAAIVSDGDSKTKSVEGPQGAKDEEKKPEPIENGSQPPVATEKREGEIGGEAAGGDRSGGGPGNAASGSIGKTRKKKGQNRNPSENLSSSAEPACIVGLQHHESGPDVSSFSANHSPPRHQGHRPYPPNGPQHYGPTPVYAVSYNTAYPTSNSTTSYYATPPSNSYAYTYPGPVMEPPPSDLVRPHQPLDSFELFSDENPNGCSIM